MALSNPVVKITVKRTPFERILELCSLLCVLAAFVPLLFYGSLDEGVRIPVHFNFQGEADGWSGRSSLGVLAGMTAIFYLVFSLGERYPRKFNYPVKVTPRNAAALYGLGVRMMRRMKFVFLLMFAYFANSSLAAVLGWETASWNRMLMPLFLIVLFGMLGVFCLKMRTLRDPEQAPDGEGIG